MAIGDRSPGQFVAGTKMARDLPGGTPLPFILSGDSFTILEQTPRGVFANEYAPVIELNPRTHEPYRKSIQILNWAWERTEDSPDGLGVTIPGLDVDPETGLLYTVKDVIDRAISVIRAASAAQVPGAGRLAPATGGAFLPAEDEPPTPDAPPVE